MLNNSIHLTNINSPVRQVKAKVELYEGSTLVNTYTHDGALISINVERIGEEKFFGFGVCHRLNVHLIDSKRQINITTANSFKVHFGVGDDYQNVFPTFYVSEVHRDENTNELSITAYDVLEKANARRVAELTLESSYTIKTFATACANLLGLTDISIQNMSNAIFYTNYGGGANFEGTESIREALNMVAEATQSIYYVDNGGLLVFKKLGGGSTVLTIDKNKYITLESKTNKRLATIVHVTELGDNVSASMSYTGSTQYVRDNAFWDLRDDIGTLVNNALTAIGGLTINQFNCEWRGNYLLEPGDKINLVTKDGGTVSSYILNDTINYDGSLSETSEWSYTDNEEETPANPSSLGDALKQTYARVDKANKQIELVASDVKANSSEISSLRMNTDSINMSVQQLGNEMIDGFLEVDDNIAVLSKKVEATMTADDITFLIQKEILASGDIDSVTTSTGFRFDAEGLTVSKTGTEMTTQITEDGMTVYRDNDAVLIADNEGVKAANLHATTYLIIGENSRFEDFNNRTCCFWIGN